MNKDRVLIVEDQVQNQKIIKALCDKMGYESMIAENGKVALELLDSHVFSIYIVDLMMPVMDGKTFINHLKKIYPDAVILVQTALDSTDTIIDIMKIGVFDYIIKPIDIGLFQTTFSKAMEFKRLKDGEVDRLRRFREEVNKVREVQASFMPQFDTVEGYDIVCAILPAEELSGDFLDGFTRDKNEFSIVLCDVSGHGIASSYIGAEIRSMFRIISQNGSSPSRLISDVNEAIIADRPNSRYLSTVVVCNIPDNGGVISFSSGGHPPALLYSAADKSCSEINTRGPLIGFSTDVKYQDISIPMKKDDCLLLYTDGVTEAFSSDRNEMFMDNRLVQTFSECADGCSLDIVHSILDNVYRFADYTMQDDDITVVCIKKR